LEKISYQLNTVLHYIGSAMMVALMLLTTVDVAGRFLFNQPLRGTHELTEFALVLIVFLALGYAQHNDDHVLIDFVYSRLPQKLQKVTYVLSNLISLTVVMLMTWRLFLYSGRMLAGNYTTSVLRVPIYPLVVIATLGTAFFASNVT